MQGDTTDAAQRILLERTRALTPTQRFEEGERLCRTARAFMRAGIRSRHPEYSDNQVEEALARLLWVDELYRAAKPGRPLLEP